MSTIPEAEFDLGGGARLKLYSNRLVHEGGLATVEILPYAHLASVRVAFERDMRYRRRKTTRRLVAMPSGVALSAAGWLSP